MNNEIEVFKNDELGIQARMVTNQDGSISINAEDTAIGFGWCRTEIKKGKEYTSVMWARLNGFCKELGFAHECAKNDYIPESLFYMLGFKAGNERAVKFQKWLAMEVLPTLRKNGSYEMRKPDKSEKLRIMDMNARSRMAQTYLKLAQIETLSPTYKNVLASKASEVLSGEPIIPLPKVEQKKIYTAAELGKKFGISANKVGRIANQNKLKTEQYGEYRRDKSKHSSHECDTWVYFEAVIPEFQRILNMGVA